MHLLRSLLRLILQETSNCLELHFCEYFEESNTQGWGPPVNITSLDDPTAATATSSGSIGCNSKHNTDYEVFLQ